MSKNYMMTIECPITFDELDHRSEERLLDPSFSQSDKVFEAVRMLLAQRYSNVVINMGKND